MSRQIVKRTMPSGAVITLELPESHPVTGTVAGVRFAGSNFGRGFQIGRRGRHDHASKYMVKDAKLVERFSVGGREVLVSESVSDQVTIVSLIGDYHELMSVFDGPRPTQENLIQLFNSLHITDTSTGMVVEPIDETLLEIVGMTMHVDVQDRGTVTVPHATAAKSLLPDTAGQPTAHGEVWRVPLPDVEAPTAARDFGYLLGCRSGLAEIYLDREGEASDAELLHWLNELKVTIPGY